MRSPWLFLTAMLLAAGPAAAQEVRTPRVEVGGNVSGFLPIFVPDGPLVLIGGGPRVALNLSQSIALQLYADAVGPVESSGLNGLYAGEVKFAFRRSGNGRRTLSLTAGLTAAYQYTQVRERRVTRPDGSIVVHQAHRRFRASAPTTLIAGIEKNHAFSRYTSANFTVQVLVGPIGGVILRTATGVSFGPGGYR